VCRFNGLMAVGGGELFRSLKGGLGF